MGATQPASMPFFLAAMIVLFPGIRSMTEEPSPDPHHGEKMMFTRVGLQALTAVLVMASLAQQ